MERFLFVAKACGLPASAPFRVGSVTGQVSGTYPQVLSFLSPPNVMG